MCSPPSGSRLRAPTPASVSPSSRAATATTPWWDLPPARAHAARGTCAGRRRCGGGGKGARRRPRTGRRRAGIGRGEDPSRRRAAAAGGATARAGAVMSERFHDIAVIVNGEEVRERVDARTTLGDFPRGDGALTDRPLGL